MTDRWTTAELIERAAKVMPGPQSNLRVPVNIKPTFIVRGQGSRLWDTEGREFIDYMIAAGPGILGHGHQEYISALKSQLDRLYYSVSGATQTPLEVELSEKIVAHVPCAEKVRFCLSGTEAVQLAIRLARAYTGRRYFIRFEGSYHGWLDNVLGGVVSDDPVANPFPQESSEDPLGTGGRDSAAFEQGFRIPFNDVEIFEKVIRRWGQQVALVLVEPMQAASCIVPRPGYLERVQELCREYGIVFGFDEVVTGFRVALGGAQEVLGVTPDLAIYGKALAAGVPVAAVAGKAGIMDQLRTNAVVGAGTFNGYPLGVAAALTTLTILERGQGAIYRQVDTTQNRLTQGLREVFSRQSIPILIQGIRGLFVCHFTDRPSVFSVRELAGIDPTRPNRLRIALEKEGILIMWGGRWYVTGAHTEEDVDRTLECAARAVARL
jgi:glutamate-1-semialdehyde 2,1-aminomutase